MQSNVIPFRKRAVLVREGDQAERDLFAWERAFEAAFSLPVAGQQLNDNAFMHAEMLADLQSVEAASEHLRDGLGGGDE